MPIQPSSLRSSHFKCAQCCEVFPRSFSDFPFCFENVQVGETIQRTKPRHRAVLCPSCLSTHVSKQIKRGYDFVLCPERRCRKSLHILDLKHILATRRDMFIKRVDQMREAVSAAHDKDVDTVPSFAGQLTSRQLRDLSRLHQWHENHATTQRALQRASH
jgi:hypothetical protein